MNKKSTTILAILLAVMLCGVSWATDITSEFQQSDTYTGVQDTYVNVFSPDTNLKDDVTVSTDRQKRRL